jgi:hypothetical protein
MQPIKSDSKKKKSRFSFKFSEMQLEFLNLSFRSESGSLEKEFLDYYFVKFAGQTRIPFVKIRR